MPPDGHARGDLDATREDGELGEPANRDATGATGGTQYSGRADRLSTSEARKAA